MVDTEHADAVASGSLRLGTFASYASQEDSRADQLDGAVDVAAHTLIAGVPEHDAAMKRLGHQGGGIFGSRFTYRPPSLYMFCMSEIGCMHVPSPPKPRTMFEIADLVGLANLLASKNQDRLKGTWGIDRVLYRRVTYDALEEFPPPDPFVKGPEFAVEQEIRLIFEPKDGRAVEAFNTLPDTDVASFITRRVYDPARWAKFQLP